MKKKIVLLTLVSVFLLSAVIGSQLIVSVAAQRTVGVSEGDWVEFDFVWQGNATMPPPDQRMEWLNGTVLEVSGTNITFEQTVRYGDGRNETATYFVDVDTGQGNGTGTFIAKDLNQGDLIYTDPPPSGPFGINIQGATINETISRTYLDETVEVNHLNITTTETYPGEGTMTKSLNCYWYRATGMPAEFILYQLIQPLEGDTTWGRIEAVIVDIIPEFPPTLILPLFMIATLIAVWLGKRIWSTKKSIKKPSPCA